jgi:hypothetical protein
MLFRKIIAVYSENHTEHTNSGILGVKEMVQAVTTMPQMVKTDVLEGSIKLTESILSYNTTDIFSLFCSAANYI